MPEERLKNAFKASDVRLSDCPIEHSCHKYVAVLLPHLLINTEYQFEKKKTGEV